MGLAALVYLALGLLLLWPAIVGGDVLSPAGLWTRKGPFPAELRDRVPPGVDILSDSTYAYVPFLRYAADRLARDHHLPVWKATASCGAPFIGNGESAVFFPTVLAAILLGAPPWVHGATALIKLAAAGCSAYVLARYLRLSWLAALLCGAIFSLGGFQAVYLLFTPTNVSLLLPLMLVAADRLMLAPSAARAALLAGLAALQHLGGHPETAFHCQVLVLVTGGVRAARLPGTWRRQALLVGSLVLGAALASLQVLPLAEYIAQSDMLYLRRYKRSAIPPLMIWPTLGFLAALATAILAVFRLKSARSPWLPALALCASVGVGAYLGLTAGMSHAFPTLLAPDWFGSVDRFLGPVNYLIVNQASAGVALPLGVIGLLYGRPRRLALCAGALFAFGLLTGLNAPGLIQLVGALPLFSIAANSRLALYALLALALLAALGLDALLRTTWPSRARLRTLLALAAPALGAWIALACGVTQGLVKDHTTSPRMITDVALEAALLPATTAGLPWTEPEPAGEGKLCVGWASPSATPLRLQLIFNQQRDAALAQFVPLPDEARAALSAPTDPARLVYAFRARLPAEKLPPGPTGMRVWVSVQGGSRPEVSDVLHAPDDPGAHELRFPAQPMRGWLDVQLVLVAALLVLVAAATGSATAGRTAGGRRLRPLLAAAVVGGLLLVVAPLLPFLPPELHFPSPPAFELLRTAPPNGRLLQMVPHIFAAELPTYYGLYDVRGYDALCPRRVAELLRAATADPGDTATVDYLPLRNDVDRDLLGLMAVQYFTDWNSPPAGLKRVHYEGERSLPMSDPFPVIVNDRFLPRARLVSGAVVIEEDEAVLSALRDSKFDRERMVVLMAGENRQPVEGPAGRATIRLDTPDQVRVEVQPEVPGWLVLSDSFYPGWVARVDGQVRSIVRANFAFRAVEVRPGDRQVDFLYKPLSFRGGCLLSVATAGGLMLWVARDVRQRRGAQSGAAGSR